MKAHYIFWGFMLGWMCNLFAFMVIGYIRDRFTDRRIQKMLD